MPRRVIYIENPSQGSHFRTINADGGPHRKPPRKKKTPLLPPGARPERDVKGNYGSGSYSVGPKNPPLGTPLASLSPTRPAGQPIVKNLPGSPEFALQTPQYPDLVSYVAAFMIHPEGHPISQGLAELDSVTWLELTNFAGSLGNMDFLAPLAPIPVNWDQSILNPPTWEGYWASGLDHSDPYGISKDNEGAQP